MIRLGIISPADIAVRRFLPALSKSPHFTFAGLALASYEEWDKSSQRNFEKESALAQTIIQTYGGKLYSSYTEIVVDTEIDALYIPLPPALHYEWANRALENNKHVLIEKPATTLLRTTQKLISKAESNNLAFHENYMFVFHRQLAAIEEIINSQQLGKIRLYRLAFGFPQRPATDFRYKKKLGGGALLDCGGYPIKLATILLGDSARLVHAQLNYLQGFEVDMYGAGTLVNQNGTMAQISFGMDNSYKCELEIWGSKGALITNRIYTSPPDFHPTAILTDGNKKTEQQLPSDDSFANSLEFFFHLINTPTLRIKTYSSILKQAELIDKFFELAKNQPNDR